MNGTHETGADASPLHRYLLGKTADGQVTVNVFREESGRRQVDVAFILIKRPEIRHEVVADNLCRALDAEHRARTGLKAA